MTRILYNVNIPRFFYTHRLPLALAAQSAGYDVHVTTSSADEENVNNIIATGLPYHPLPLAQHGTNPLTELNTFRAMVKLYRELKPDIIHHVSIKPVLYGGIAARLTGVPATVGAMSGLGILFISEENKLKIIRRLVHPFLKVALGHKNTAMIFQNNDDLKRFVNMGVIAEKDTVLIRGSGVEMARFVPQPEIVGKPTVLFAGRLMWQKGLGDFAEAARKLHDKARFVVVGFAEKTSSDTVSQEQLEAWANEGIIEWWGKRDDMPNVFAQSHIVCLPSTYGEGVPKVLIEAAACARPIVTTDTPGCRDIARDGENGLLVPPNDVPALVNALETLIDDSALRQKFGARGRDIAAAEFSLDYVLGETLALYEKLLNNV